MTITKIILQKKISQNSEMVIAIEERNFGDGFKDEMYNSILEFVVSRAKELATSPPGDQDEMNQLMEERESFFEESEEAKKALDITQNDSSKHPEMVIMEDGSRKESGGFEDDERLDILLVQQGNEERDESDGKMVEGSRDLCEQTVALSHESSFTAITEPKMSSCNDLVMIKAKEDFQLIDHSNGIMHIEEDKKGVEVINHPSAVEGVEGLIDEIQGTEFFLLQSCTHENPAMIIVVEEKTQLEENTTCDLNDVIQEGKTEENLLNGFKENVESSEAEEKLRENEECPLTESQRVEFSLEHYNLMAYKENPLIQFQGIEPIVREAKACLDDRFPLSIEPNMIIVQPIQDNNLSKSEKALEIEESHIEAGAEDSEISPDEEVEEIEDDSVSVQYHELEAPKDKLEREIECPQTLPADKKEEAEIHKESVAQIKEEEQILKLSFDLVEKGVKKIVAQTVKQDTKTGLIDVDEKHQRKVDGDENTLSSKEKQQRIATKKVKRTEYMFMGYPNGYFFLLTTVATAFAVLAFLYTEGFITRTAILENFITS
ncbi:uncharacterized protein LOC110104413 isoform X5 [Dendrobium catenatum]|uniref:uncharacterized protein LOC110104413 isoform X5 n=1 Tax=Dendrobium catenatum TaxID=906689 RepID=UPI00109F7DE6|nr:uncharacterized protein LOC110104413 isoform X5 [Dendrobium catenatum]